MDDVLASTEYARAAAYSIDNLLRNGNLKDSIAGVPLVDGLRILAVRLQQFRQHSDQLGQWLHAGASSSSPNIQSTVSELGRECRKVSVIVFNEVDRLRDGTSQTVDPKILAEYDSVLAAFSRAFVFLTQILSLDGEKDSKLNHPDVHQLVSNAQISAEKVVSSRESLLDVNNPNLPTISVGGV